MNMNTSTPNQPHYIDLTKEEYDLTIDEPDHMLEASNHRGDTFRDKLLNCDHQFSQNIKMRAVKNGAALVVSEQILQLLIEKDQHYTDLLDDLLLYQIRKVKCFDQHNKLKETHIVQFNNICAKLAEINDKITKIVYIYNEQLKK